MGFIIKAVVYLAGAAILFLVAVMAASEFSGEVVTLRTFQENQLSRETSVWIVEDRRQLYLRAGNAESGWLLRLKTNPNVELVRDGVTKPYKAVVMPRMQQRINALMAEKYGWGETLVGLARDPAGVTIIRLDPVRS